MNTQGLEQMLSALRTTASQAANQSMPATSSSTQTDFASVLKNSIDKVNQVDQQANQMAEKLAAGDTTQNLHEVMMALQTASVSFQEMTQIRNKLVTAYQDVMNMQV